MPGGSWLPLKTIISFSPRNVGAVFRQNIVSIHGVLCSGWLGGSGGRGSQRLASNARVMASRAVPALAVQELRVYLTGAVLTGAVHDRTGGRIWGIVRTPAASGPVVQELRVYLTGAVLTGAVHDRTGGRIWGIVRAPAASGPVVLGDKR